MNHVITERRRVKLHIPMLVEDFYHALQGEDYETCKELKDTLYESYESFEDKLQLAFRTYLVRYLDDNGIDNTGDLNGLFDGILGKK